MDEIKIKSGQLLDQLRGYDAAQSVLLGDTNQSSVEHKEDFKVMQDFLDRPMNDPQEVCLKKVIASAIITASEKGTLSISIDKDPEAIASMVDDYLTRAKAAYQLEQKRIDYTDSVDAILDHSIARTTTFVKEIADRVIDKSLNAVSDLAFALIGKVYPPIKTAKPYFDQVILPHLSQKCKDSVHRGIDKAARAGENFLRSAATKVTTIANKIGVLAKCKINH